MFNEARIGLQSMEDVRNVPAIFPAVEVGGTGPRRGDLISGTEQFSGINAPRAGRARDPRRLHLPLRRAHHHARAPTTSSSTSRTSSCRASTATTTSRRSTRSTPASRASTRSASSKATRPRPASDFAIEQYGVYASDQWRAASNFTVTFGLRADLAVFGDDPNFNPNALALFGIDTSQVPDDNLILAPRVGFNWDPQSDGKSQLRGGVGLFAGRTPYVWVSNVYAGTGIGSQSLTARWRDSVQPGSVQSAALRGGRRAVDRHHRHRLRVPAGLARDAGLRSRAAVVEAPWQRRGRLLADRAGHLLHQPEPAPGRDQCARWPADLPADQHRV